MVVCILKDDFMPKEPKIIDFGKFEEIIALIITKKEDPTNRNLTFFGWDGRYELQGKKGAIFKGPEDVILRDLGLKAQFWSAEYVFFDFDQLLGLYPYSECILNILESYRHSDVVIRLSTDYNNLESAFKSIKKQIEDIQKNTFERILFCVKK